MRSFLVIFLHTSEAGTTQTERHQNIITSGACHVLFNFLYTSRQQFRFRRSVALSRRGTPR